MRWRIALKEITKAVLHALAKLRKQMKATIPKQRRGRPSHEQQLQAPGSNPKESVPWSGVSLLPHAR